MELVFQSLPEYIQEHLKGLVLSSNISDHDSGLEILAKNWIDKRDLFEAQTKALDMVNAQEFDVGSNGGALMLTLSGSLIRIGTLNDGSRPVEYYSIKLRKDVPDAIKIESAKIKACARLNQILEFDSGPLQKTSAIYRIAVFKDDISNEVQEIRLHEAIIFLTNGFVKINRTLADGDPEQQGQFTYKSIISQIAQRNELSQKHVKSVLDDYWGIIESGVLLGEKIQIGKIGKLYLKKRPAQKARIGKNFSTGEEVTIPAKPVAAVPKISFSSHIKEKSLEINLGSEPE